MFTRRFTIGRILGFPIRIDLSWFIIVALIAWTLANAYRQGSPLIAQYQGMSSLAYWMMGLAAALGLFVSVLLHELGHATVARRRGVEMRGITLFIFGGVAEMTEEPKTPGAAFAIAVAGPLVSVVLGVALWFVAGLLPYGGAAETLPFRETEMQMLSVQVDHPFVAGLHGVITWLAFINIALVVFNSIPAFPLDGGRVLRAILWKIKGNLKWATRRTSQIGEGFGLLFILFAVFRLFLGDIIGALWFGLIGLFLRGAARMSYQQLLLRRELEGEPIRKFMRENPVTVSKDISVEDLVENYVYKHHFKMFPVTEGDRLTGCVTTEQVKQVPREEWSQRTVAEIMGDCSPRITIDADADATEAMSRMNTQKTSRLMVLDDGRLVGVIALKDLLQFLSSKVELEEE